MNKLLIAFIPVCLALSSISLHAQNEKTSNVYTEHVVVNLSADFLITGETLYYSIHSLETEKNKPSTFSKLAYVELIGENARPVLQTKISLVDGTGAGDFFLPSTIPSGNYTLIAYTRWMRNFPLENFFQHQITIINPYLKSPVSETAGKVDKPVITPRSSNGGISKETKLVKISVDKEKYSSRQKVIVTIKNNDPVSNYKISLNVHRYDKSVGPVTGVSKLDSSDATTVAHPQLKKEFISFLPDLRGETLAGVVKESSSQNPVANTNVYLSVPGSSYFFQISKTDSVGRFYFSIKNIQMQTGIHFQVDRPSGSLPIEVILEDEFVNDYGKFKPLPLSIDTSIRKQIEQRNIYSQIENAYFIKKRDSILSVNQKPFFGTPDKIYKLDDFTRFPTMEDIFREYMYEVFVLKRDGKFLLFLLNGNSQTGARFSNSPLLLVDGIPIFDTEILMSYNPLLIKTVSLVTRQYVYGGSMYDGILSVNTYTGNAKELSVKTIQKDYTSWQLPKKYFSPAYTNESLTRIPDYRVQLFWNPIINLDPGQEYIGEFYTSDVEGEFLIEVKGFNSNGEMVNIQDRIEVRK